MRLPNLHTVSMRHCIKIRILFVGKPYGSVPLIARINSQAHCDYFHPITMLVMLFKLDASTRCELASGYCDEWKRSCKPGFYISQIIIHH